MSYYCPVCNGLQNAAVRCPKCAGPAEDCGRFNDFLGPYAPYRAIDDMNLSNGFYDRANHVCVHVMHCLACEHQFQTFIHEWSQA
ncbi:hypothetical protein [Paenibacillus contaminans]|uniref:Uncharacterized protein n=1 Tax=Paenibacillus contaminans TaxID=450362 RepID=A0A329ML52_9BACL|nr:hypothetical protein [Paenibacillus contaminans]RAV20352.1 hypothetical protein DQG23_15390 [Paenibacillus contaminans]